MKYQELPYPDHFDPANSRKWQYQADFNLLLPAAEQWRRAHLIPPAAESRFKIHLLIVDAQKDFCFPEGALYVGGRSGSGAMDDNARLAAFIYRNLHLLEKITVSLDSHLPYQIFFPSFWVDEAGRHPQPHTEVGLSEVQSGKLRPDPAVAPWLCQGDPEWLFKQVCYYCEALESQGKYKLYLWPFHCMVGSEGQTVAGLIQEARIFHSFVRRIQSLTEIKGGLPLAENYSLFRPEVLFFHDGKALGHINSALLETLLKADAVLVAGQADSHCVKHTLEDLLVEIRNRDPGLARKVYILTDCMSSVTIPDGGGGFCADFTPLAQEALARFEAAGMHRVRSTDPIWAWDGMIPLRLHK